MTIHFQTFAAGPHSSLDRQSITFNLKVMLKFLFATSSTATPAIASSQATTIEQFLPHKSETQNKRSR